MSCGPSNSKLCKKFHLEAQTQGADPLSFLWNIVSTPTNQQLGNWGGYPRQSVVNRGDLCRADRVYILGRARNSRFEMRAADLSRPAVDSSERR